MQPSDSRKPENLPDPKVLGETGLGQDSLARAESAQVWDELPEPIRHRLAELAAEAIPGIAFDRLPPALRPVANFAPSKRASAGARLLLSGLRDSPVFRASVLEWIKEHRASALEMGQADSVNVAAAALLVADPSVREYVWLVRKEIQESSHRAERHNALAVNQRLEAEVARLKVSLEEAGNEVRAVRDEQRGELDKLRGRLREQGKLLRQAKDALEANGGDNRRENLAREAEAAGWQAQLDRERQRVIAERARADRAVQDAQIAKRIAKEARDADEMRLTLLVNTIEQALQGLRRELSLGGSRRHPADCIEGVSSDSSSGQEISELGFLDRLLALPNVHLIVDGYNVTKTGYPSLTLAEQRDRLIHQLSVFAARSRCEVTLVFDGAAVSSPIPVRRGVRVLFSDPGVLADDVIRSLVSAEPPGRPLIVVTSDREIIDSVREQGAHSIASALFLAKLS